MLQPKLKTKIAPKKSTNKNGIIPPGAEKSRLPFTREERAKMPNVNNMGSAKSGKSIKKAKSGTSMKKSKYGCK